jgi:hypothetical protein
LLLEGRAAPAGRPEFWEIWIRMWGKVSDESYSGDENTYIETSQRVCGEGASRSAALLCKGRTAPGKPVDVLLKGRAAPAGRPKFWDV